MPEKSAAAIWSGDLRKGYGEVSTPSGAVQRVPLSFATRFENVPGASPEEFLAAAHAGCYSMALADTLARRGHAPLQISTRSTVSVEPQAGGWKITRSHLEVQAQVIDLDNDTFQETARLAEKACPVSNALRGNVDIVLNATLVPVPEREMAL